MNIQRLFNPLISIAPRKIFDSITPFQKKILLVASVAIALFVAALLASRLYTLIFRREEGELKQEGQKEIKSPSHIEPEEEEITEDDTIEIEIISKQKDESSSEVKSPNPPEKSTLKPLPNQIQEEHNNKAKEDETFKSKGDQQPDHTKEKGEKATDGDKAHEDGADVSEPISIKDEEHEGKTAALIAAQDGNPSVLDDLSGGIKEKIDEKGLEKVEEKGLEKDLEKVEEKGLEDVPILMEDIVPVDQKIVHKAAAVTGVNRAKKTQKELEFFQACRGGDLKFVQAQLDLDCALLYSEIEYLESDGTVHCRATPLFVAAMSGQDEIVEELLTRGAAIQLEGEPRDLFFWVCMSGRNEMIADLFSRHKDHLAQLLPENLIKLYSSLLLYRGNEIDEAELTMGLQTADMTYPLSPVHALVLGNCFCTHEISDQLLLLGPVLFVGMNPLDVLYVQISIKDVLADNECFGPMNQEIVTKKIGKLNDFGDVVPVSQDEFNAEIDFLTAAVAARLGDTKTLEALKEKNVKLKSEHNKIHPLFYAIAHEQIAALEVLRHMIPGFTRNCVSEDWKALRNCRIPLELAAALGKLKVLAFIKDQCKLSLIYPFQYYGNEAMSAVSVAAQHGQVEVIRSIRDAYPGKDINRSFPAMTGIADYRAFEQSGPSINEFQAISPALKATTNEQIEVLEFLRLHCDVDLTKPLSEGTERGLTLCYIAARDGKLEALRYFSSIGIDITEAIQSGPFEGMTPVIAAAENGHVDILRELHQHGGTALFAPISADGKPRDGLTPEVVAAGTGQLSVLQYMHDELHIDLSQPVQKGKFEGFTPALVAAQKKHRAVLNYLEQKCDVDLSKEIASGIYKGLSPKDVLGFSKPD